MLYTLYTSARCTTRFLSSLLFTLHINDLADVIDSFALLFADDVQIYRRISSINKYKSINKLFLNPIKCQILSFNKSGLLLRYTLMKLMIYLITRVASTRDLGASLSYDFCFTEPVSILLSTSRVLDYLLRSSKNFKNIKALTILFNTLVKSPIEHASIIWRPNFKKYSRKCLRKLKNDSSSL